MLMPYKASADQAYSKKAYNITQGRDATTVTARSGDVIEYTLSYYNSTGLTQTVTLQDNLDSVLDYADIYSLNDATLSGTMLTFPSVMVTYGTRLDRTFQVRIKSNLSSGTWVMNNNYGNQVSVAVSSDTYYSGSGDRWHSAYNQTQGVNAQSVYAQPGDFIQYTLSYENRTSSTQWVAVEMDVGDILNLSELVNYGDATLSGNTLRYPQVSVSSGSRIDRNFQVRVRNVASYSGDLIMSSYYGNGLDVHVNNSGGYVTNYPIVKGSYTAPKTGPEGMLAAVPAGFLTLFWYFKRRRALGKAV
jgi:CO dehydrogenase/acetyl-CoA synthase gamma subunit (corrinoid Fe-S protein)